MTGPPNRSSSGLTQRMQAVAAEVFAKREASKAAAPPSIVRQQATLGVRLFGGAVFVAAWFAPKFLGVPWVGAYLAVGFGAFLAFHAELLEYAVVAPKLLAGLLGALGRGNPPPPAGGAP